MSEGTPEERLRTALALYEVGEQLMRSRLRRESPGITETEVTAAIQRWLQERPGATFGDYPGLPSTRVLGGAGR